VTVLGPETLKAVQAVEDRHARSLRGDGGRLWAAFMLSRSPEVCESILLGRPVMVRNLDPEALRRALRGERLPATPDSYIRVRSGHLDALAESGPLTKERKAA